MCQARKTVTSRQKKYQPHEIRSHPFKFIDLPLVLLGLTSFYWIVLCPFLYGYFTNSFDVFSKMAPFYLLLAFVLYLLILAFFVFVWRYKFRKGARYDYYTHSEIEVMKPETSEQSDFSEGEKPEYSAKEKPTPFRIVSENSRPVSQNLSSPLTPRELFLFDLIEIALKTDKETSHRFIERERENCLEEWRPFRSIEEEEGDKNGEAKYGEGKYEEDKEKEEKGKEEQKREFFIANAKVQQACVSQAFLFVEEASVDDDRSFELVTLVD